jgi:peptidoglycan/LPS O-acetylase OafA/YrhL
MRAESSALSSERAEILPRIATLDGLRGIAILLVLFHNLAVLDRPSSALAAVLDTLLDRGWIGVQLFFVLSGFLITSILLRTKTAPNYFQVFYARRVLRIFPLYYLTLIVFLWLLPLCSSAIRSIDASSAGHQVWLWLFLSNWADPRAPSSNLFPHFWSLAVEEQFYLVWPLLVLLLSPRRLLRVCIALSLAALVIRSVMLWTGSSHEATYMYTVCRMDALAVGAGIAAATCQGQLSRFSFARVITALAVLLIIGAAATKGFPRTTVVGQTFGYSVLAACCGLLLYAALIAKTGSAAAKLLESRFLTTFGKYSYGIYVVHVPMHQLLGRPLLGGIVASPVQSLLISTCYTVVMTAAVLVAAMIVYHTIELPCLRLKRFFKPGYRQKIATNTAIINKPSPAE